ncbi:single-stranded-DNA-specific exonuclease RecJ, partial [Desulfobacterales bacterium HSG16]|nr:single-stranded-DNA-specific exonuclease RecJ [Desulfobacterales bacterium HSG16]
EEGYGLKPFHITGLALPNRVSLIITVDCGIGSHEAVLAAKNAGIDVIVTDHHSVPDKLPEAVAVINPKRSDCTAGFDNLAGVGVAFYLAAGLRKKLRDTGFWKTVRKPEPNLKSFCDLVALGTIADLVPLREENRIFARAGVEIINSGKRSGLMALSRVSKIKAGQCDSVDIAFRMAPRLNAAGRMNHAHQSVALLTARDMKQAAPIASSLDTMNKERQKMEKEIFNSVVNHIEENPSMFEKKTIVLSNPDWHEGVLGIVASRIVERYFKPAFLIATRNGFGKGSGRSISGIDLYKGLLKCSDCLVDFGGHAMAAGLKVKNEDFNSFQERFEQTVSDMMGEEEYAKQVAIDYEIHFEEVTDRLLDELEKVKPFGAGNPEPLFMAADVNVQSSSIVGQNHRRMVLRQGKGKNSKFFEAIQFNIDTQETMKDHFDQIAFHLQWNRFTRRKKPQIIIRQT